MTMKRVPALYKKAAIATMQVAIRGFLKAQPQIQGETCLRVLKKDSIMSLGVDGCPLCRQVYESVCMDVFRSASVQRAAKKEAMEEFGLFISKIHFVATTHHLIVILQPR